MIEPAALARLTMQPQRDLTPEDAAARLREAAR